LGAIIGSIVATTLLKEWRENVGAPVPARK
jgi:hypothetical protein